MSEEVDLSWLRRVDLNLLVVLSVLVRECSIRRAAEKLHLGSPAVSMSLGRLRVLLNDGVLVRQGRTMVATPKALYLAGLIDPFLHDLRQGLFIDVDFDPTKVSRSIKFAIADDLEQVFLPRLIGALERRAPGIRLLVKDADFQAIDESLQAGHADVMLAALLPEQHIKQPHRLLYEDHFVAVFDANRTQLSIPLGLDEYLATPQLLISLKGDASGMMEGPLEAIGAKRNVAGTLTRFSTLPKVLKLSNVLCNVPSLCAQELEREFGLSVSELPFESPTFPVGIAWQRALEKDPVTLWFVDLLEELLMGVGNAEGSWLK